MSAPAYNIAALFLDQMRANLLNTPIDDATGASMVVNVANGKKINVVGDDAQSQASLVNLLAMKFVKLRPDAVLPTKATDGSIGFDLTILGVHSTTPDSSVVYCHTGLKVRPPPGFYTKIYPRSSICKSGYSLANSVGIIDTDYRGELLVPLRRHDANAVITFPCRMAQLVPELDHSFIIGVEVEALDETVRGEGGFGSTGK